MMTKEFNNTTLKFYPAFSLKVDVTPHSNEVIETLSNKVKSELNLEDKDIRVLDSEKNGELKRTFEISIDFDKDDFKDKQAVINNIFNNFSAVYGTEKPFISKKVKVEIVNEKDEMYESTIVFLFGDKYTKIPKKINGKLSYSTIVNEFKQIMFAKENIYQDAEIANKVFNVESSNGIITTSDNYETDIQLFGNINFMVTKIKSVNTITGKKWIATESSTGFCTFEQDNGQIIKVNWSPDAIPLKIATVADLNVLARLLLISWVEKKIVDKNPIFVSINEKLSQYLKHELTFTEEDIEAAKKAKEEKSSKPKHKKHFKAKSNKGGNGKSHQRKNAEDETYTPFEDIEDMYNDEEEIEGDEEVIEN